MRRVDNIMKYGTLLAAILAVMSLASSVCARTWRVELDGSGDFMDIQPAVEAASPGDTIRIGPGRFDTFHPVTTPAWTEDVIVGVLKDNLAFIGSGSGVTILGPAVFWNPVGASPKVLYSYGGCDAIISDMTIENVKSGIMWEGGNLAIQSCTFRAQDSHFFALYLLVENGSVHNCTFDLPGGGTAIGIFNPMSNLQGISISGCTIVGADFGVRVGYGAPNIAITDCTFDVKYWGMVFDQFSTCVIDRCRISGNHDVSVYVLNGSTVNINNSELLGAQDGVVSANATVEGTGNVILNTSHAAVWLAGGRISLHGSHLLPASGLAVLCEQYVGTPVTIDMSGNYWGTTDSVAIAALIQDHADDPAIPYTVVYAPYANGPVPTETTTWGDLKVLFR